MRIIRDRGSAFPILAGNTGTISSVTTDPFSTAAANTLIVVSVGLGNFVGTAQTPVSVTWNGGAPAGASTFTKQIEGDYSSLGNHTASIWTATCSQAITSQSIVVAGNASVASTAISVHVDALTFATTTGGVSQSANTTVMDVTLTGVTAGSWLYVAAFGEATTTLSTDANTTQTNSAVIGGSVIAANGTNETGTSGNILVGWSTTESFSAVAGLEIKAATSGGMDTSESVLATDSFRSEKFYTPYTFFQSNAFQSNAFAILGGATGPSLPTFSESASATEAFGLALVGIAGFSESVTATDTVAMAKVAALSFSESVTATESFAVAKVATATFTESTTATDAFGVALAAAVAFSESTNATDTWDLTVAGGGGTATFQDSVTATDTFIPAKVIADSISESLTATDSFALALQLGVAFTESATATDAWDLSIVAPISGAFTDTVTPTDSFAMLKVMALSFSESVTTLDAFIPSGYVPPAPSGRTYPAVPWWRKPQMYRMRRGGR